jgi:hypothetical protein
MLKFIIGEPQGDYAKPIPKTYQFYGPESVWNNPYIASRKSNRYAKSIEIVHSDLNIKHSIQMNPNIEKKFEVRDMSVDRMKKRQAEREIVILIQLQQKSKQRLTTSKLDESTDRESISHSFYTRKHRDRNHSRVGVI